MASRYEITVLAPGVKLMYRRDHPFMIIRDDSHQAMVKNQDAEEYVKALRKLADNLESAMRLDP